jgi:xanthine dehydrogenase accessory factor
MKTLLSSLMNEGFSEEQLAGIHTPIGLSISSQTPEEIAVSIAAEIISVKNR